MYLLSVFKDRQAELILKEGPNADPTYRNATKEYFQIFSKGLYDVKTDNLIYRNYCGMKTNRSHLPRVNVEGSNHV